jgi:hypothetical protein
MIKISHSRVFKTVSYERILSKFQKKTVLFVILFTSFSGAYCQSNVPESVPIDVVIGKAAAHVPAMIRLNDQGQETNYNEKENLAAIEVWISSYPDEVAEYKKIIVQSLNSVEVDSLSPVFTSVYNDTKVQYEMIALILKW